MSGTSLRRAEDRNLGLDRRQGGCAVVVAGRAHGLRRCAQGDELFGGRRLEQAVEARCHPVAFGRRLFDAFELREELLQGVAHALDRAPASARHLGHLIEGEPLGRPGEDARQVEK
jgi:hypothetical protein